MGFCAEGLKGPLEGPTTRPSNVGFGLKGERWTFFRSPGPGLAICALSTAAKTAAGSPLEDDPHGKVGQGCGASRGEV